VFIDLEITYLERSQIRMKLEV